jgi:hypothetical protein
MRGYDIHNLIVTQIILKCMRRRADVALERFYRVFTAVRPGTLCTSEGR